MSGNDFYEDDEPVEDVIAAFLKSDQELSSDDVAAMVARGELVQATGPRTVSTYQSDPRCAVTMVAHFPNGGGNPIFMGYPMQRLT